MLRRLGYGPSLLPKEINFVHFSNTSNSLQDFFRYEHSTSIPRSTYKWIKNNFREEVEKNRVRLFIAGRGPSCDIHLATEKIDNITSFYHCIFIQIDHCTYVIDLNTSNGTMVSNKWIPPMQPVLLSMRDQICLGSDASIYREHECIPNPFRFIYFKMEWNSSKPVVAADERMNEFMKRYRDESPTCARSDVQCCVCFETMKEPYVAPCGHSCCRECFVQWKTSLKRKGYRFVCPLCRNLIDEKALYPNITLSNIISNMIASQS